MNVDHPNGFITLLNPWHTIRTFIKRHVATNEISQLPTNDFPELPTPMSLKSEDADIAKCMELQLLNRLKNEKRLKHNRGNLIAIENC